MKYDELLRRCQQATDQLSHKAVQTSNSPFASIRTRRRLSSTATQSDLTAVPEDGQQPEYKVLFNEIFTCIQKTKVDLSENRHPVKDSNCQTADWSCCLSACNLQFFYVARGSKCTLSMSYKSSISCHIDTTMFLFVSTVPLKPSLFK